MKIRDKTRLVIYADDQAIADRVVYCSSHDSRRKGLLGQSCIEPDEGILMEMPGFAKGNRES